MNHESKSKNRKPQWVGLFRACDDPIEWQDAVRSFPNGIPRFTCQEDYMEFMKQVGSRPSNPLTPTWEPTLYHSISLLTDWNQIQTILIPKIMEYGRRLVKPKETIDLHHNRWSSEADTIEADQADQEAKQQESKQETKEANTDNDNPRKHEWGKENQESKQSKNLAHEYLTDRLGLPIHVRLSFESTLNTLDYVFDRMRCGIFGMIRNNELVIFCPFVNKHYRNRWTPRTRLMFETDQGKTTWNADQYYRDKQRRTHYREQVLPNVSQWWANGNLICNQQPDQWWGDAFLFQLKDMLVETCRCRQVPDCDFFVNKRDYPQIKYHVTNDRLDGYLAEPYGFIFDKDDKCADEDIVLDSHQFTSMAPMLSFYTSSRFADLPFPSTEDWEAATNCLFIPSMIPSVHSSIQKPRQLYRSQDHVLPWTDKKPIAFFRGTATGGGTTVDTNQRLHVAFISHVLETKWTERKEDQEKHKRSRSGDEPSRSTDEQDQDPILLDAKLTGWNKRDKKIAGRPVTYIKPEQFPFTAGRQHFVPIAEQQAYKYVIYIEGHCAACRYGFMMSLGSVILKVTSQCVANQMWYFPLLKPYVDHVPVKADLSDLIQQIKWCQDHDEECQHIAHQAKQLHHHYLGREGILDYMQLLFCSIAQHNAPPDEWWSRPVSASRQIQEAKKRRHYHEDDESKRYDSRHYHSKHHRTTR